MIYRKDKNSICNFAQKACSYIQMDRNINSLLCATIWQTIPTLAYKQQISYQNLSAQSETYMMIRSEDVNSSHFHADSIPTRNRSSIINPLENAKALDLHCVSVFPKQECIACLWRVAELFVRLLCVFTNTKNVSACRLSRAQLCTGNAAWGLGNKSLRNKLYKFMLPPACKTAGFVLSQKMFSFTCARRELDVYGVSLLLPYSLSYLM